MNNTSQCKFSVYPPKPTGKWGIRRVSDVLTDHKRKDPHSDCDRRLALDIWLPVNQPTQCVQYDQRAIEFWRNANFWTGTQQAILETELAQFGEHLSLGKDTTNKPHLFPVVVFIPKRIQKSVFGKEKAPAIKRSKMTQYFNMGSFLIV